MVDNQAWESQDGLDYSDTWRDLYRSRNQRLPAGRVL